MNGYIEHHGWPTIDYARSLIKPLNNIGELIPVLKGYLDSWNTALGTDVIEARARALCIPELLLMYPNLWIHVIRGENLEKVIYEKFNRYGHLGEYVKYLETTFNKRRADIKAFKQEIAHVVAQKKLIAQQKYITHIFSNIINVDCASVIASFV